MGRPITISQVDRNCVICSFGFQVKSNNVKTITCSMKCSYISRGKNRAANIIKKICPVCNQQFATKRVKTEHQYCSQQCSYRSEKRNGKISYAQKGIPEKLEVCKQNSDRQKALWLDPKYRNQMLAKVLPEWSRALGRKRAILRRKQLWTEEYDRMHTSIMKGRPKAIIKYKQWWANLNDIERMKFVKKILRSTRRRPNNLEAEFIRLLEQWCPNHWKYVGDGQLIIGGKCPDFAHVNRSLIIEVNGDYWHRNDDGYDRMMHFAKYGYNTLIIRECDLKNNLEKVRHDLLEFTAVTGNRFEGQEANFKKTMEIEF